MVQWSGDYFATSVAADREDIMRPMLTRSTQSVACVAALLTLAACGGGGDGEKTSTSAASSSASSKPTYDDEYAFAKAKKVNENLRAHDPNTQLPKNTKWATTSYIKAYNDSLAQMKKQGVTEKGKVTVTATHPAKSNPDAAGGWDLTMYQCSTSTVRYYRDGEDITADPADPSKPAPKGPQKNVHLKIYTTPDQGKTWQLDKSQLLRGKDAKESPCAN